MKLILKQDVANLGDAGEIVDVADGYGNNFLVPRGLAMRATKGALADADAISRTRAKREARTLDEAQGLKQKLESRPITVTAKAGEDGTLYGSIGNTVVVQALRDQLGITLERRKVPMERPLKELGEHEVEVRLHRDLAATLRVSVINAE